MRAVLLPGLDGTGALHGPFVDALGDLPCEVLRYPAGLTRYSDLERHVRLSLPESPFILIAESFSGPLALRLQSAPNLTGIVFVASFARTPRRAPTVLAKLLRFAPLGNRALVSLMQPMVMGRWRSPNFTKQLHTALQSVPPRTFADRLAEVLGADETVALQPPACPMIYLRARHDRLVPARASHLFAAAGVQIVTTDGPHFLLQANPEQAALAIRDFVNTLKLAHPAATP